MSVRATSPILPLLSLLLVTAIARVLVDDALAEPYKQYSYDTSSRRWEYASAFVNLISDLPEVLRSSLPVLQGGIIALAYYLGVLTGLNFGWELVQKNLRGEAPGLIIGTVIYNRVQVLLKPAVPSSHDFRWYNTHKL